MSTFSLSILGVLEGLGIRASTSQTAADKEGFQSLLDISAAPEDTARYEAAPHKEKRRDAQSSDAAPAFANTASENEYVKTSATKEDAILAVPADEKRTTRDLKIKEAPEDAPRPVEKTNAANDNDVIDDASTAGAAEKKKLASALQDHLAFLRDLLELLKAFGGALNEGGNATIQVASVTQVTTTTTFLFASTQEAENFSTDLLPGDALKNLRALFAKLQANLPVGGDLTAAQGGDLRQWCLDCKHGSQILWAAFKKQSSGNAETLANDLQALTKQVSEAYQSLTRLANLLAAKQDATGTQAQDPLDATLTPNTQGKDASPIAFKSAAPVIATPVESAVAQSSTPVATTNSQQSALATPLTAPATQNATPDFGGGSQQGGQSLPQALGIAREPGQPSSTQGAGNSEFAKLLAQTKTPVLEQVIFQIKTRPADGSSKILIKLEPAELGKLEIKMHVDAGGKTSLTVTADNKNTLDLLQRDARGLERALADAGLKADTGSLNFSLRGDGQDQQYPSFAHGYPKALPEETEPALDTLTRDYAVQVSEGLDIRI